MEDISNNVGMVTALGMGTVFLCLILLYGITRILGVLFTPKPAPVETAPIAVEAAAATASAEDDSSAIMVAMTLVLARNRAALAKPAAAKTADDPWKMAGRIRMLRRE
jgi:Na+-transporting methylmalonyl-CoA/oxaloacetate decarboxylase gamma subunit